MSACRDFCHDLIVKSTMPNCTERHLVAAADSQFPVGEGLKAVAVLVAEKAIERRGSKQLH